MLEQVENKIQELKKLRAEEYYKKKDADLKSWGLTTKVDGKKVTPIIVTDEEYEELVKASNGVGKIGRNSVAIMLNILSIGIVVVGVIVGILLADLTEAASLIAFTASVAVSGVLAVIFRALAEAIRLLQQLIDAKPIEKPDPAAFKKPQVKKAGTTRQPAAPAQQPAAPAAQAPMYVPYPAQNQTYVYPYPVYAAQQPAAPAQPANVAYTPEGVQAYYQQTPAQPAAEAPVTQ